MRKLSPDDTALRRHVLESGLSFRAVAERAGLSEFVFGRIAAGERLARIDEARAIVAALRSLTGRQIRLDDLWPIAEVTQ